MFQHDFEVSSGGETLLAACRSGGNQPADAALSLSPSLPVGFAEASLDVGHRGPELSCCFEESESDCNGPSCAAACLPLRFAAHLISSPRAHSHNCTHFLPRSSLVYPPPHTLSPPEAFITLKELVEMPCLIRYSGGEADDSLILSTSIKSVRRRPGSPPALMNVAVPGLSSPNEHHSFELRCCL